MIVNKKFDRLKQWGKERMGGEVKTATSDEFKALEVEMQLRHEGMERLDRSAKTYHKSLSTRNAGEEKEKVLPVAYFGSAMVTHSEDFEPESEFGQCLASLGRANERIARLQETYAANTSSSWLESVERSLVQMKEYQAARKKLESRRLAYDTAQQKMQKSKKEDFRMEEELRSQRAKYEESQEEVLRRMVDIKEAEVDTVGDLTGFVEAELAYYDRCREVLVQLKRDWPAQPSHSRSSRTASPVNGISRRVSRSRANSLTQRYGGIAEDEVLDPPPTRTAISSRLPSGPNSPRRELPGFDFSSSSSSISRPAPNPRTLSAFEPRSSSSSRAESPVNALPRLTRVPTEPTQFLGGRAGLRMTKNRDNLVSSGEGNENVFGDDAMSSSSSGGGGEVSAFERLERSRTGSFSIGGDPAVATKQKPPPPPPPPSRSKKPPPPPPLKRSALSTSEIPRY